jgi:IS30 family transposase
MSCQELSIEEHITIQFGQLQGMSQRAIARLLGRSPSTISRELRRNAPEAGRYSASQAHQHMRHRRVACRPRRKLLRGSQLFDLVVYLLRKRFSPQQIAGQLNAMEFPNIEDAYVCRETIYNAIYALPMAVGMSGFGNHGLWLAFLVFMGLRAVTLGWVGWRLQQEGMWIGGQANTR